MDDSDAAAEDRLKNGEKETDAESVASAASDAASDNQEEADENRFHEKLIALKNDPDPFFYFFNSANVLQKQIVKVSKYPMQNIKFSHTPKKQRNFLHFFALAFKNS